jgi:hypothetical protein
MQLTPNAVDNLNNNGAGTQTHNPPLILKLVGCKKVEREGDDKPKTVRYRYFLTLNKYCFRLINIFHFLELSFLMAKNLFKVLFISLLNFIKMRY